MRTLETPCGSSSDVAWVPTMVVECIYMIKLV